MAAGPLLFQCIRRLRHLPFHNAFDGRLPGHVLTVDLLSVAVAILLGCPIRTMSDLIEQPLERDKDDKGADIDNVAHNGGEEVPWNRGLNPAPTPAVSVPGRKKSLIKKFWHSYDLLLSLDATKEAETGNLTLSFKIEFQILCKQEWCGAVNKAEAFPKPDHSDRSGSRPFCRRSPSRTNPELRDCW